MDYEDEDFNPDADAARDYLDAAQRGTRCCIDTVLDARLGSRALTDGAIEHIFEQLLAIERALSRAEGELTK